MNFKFSVLQNSMLLFLNKMPNDSFLVAFLNKKKIKFRWLNVMLD